VTYFALSGARDNPPVLISGGAGNGLEMRNGSAFANVRWEHFQNVPRFRLTNQESEEFDSADFNGRPMAVSFFFASCPTFCRDLNKQIGILRDRLNEPELMFVSISVDPENDTPEILKKYARDFDATTDDWNFLTGPLYQIKQLGSHAFNVSVEKNTHTDNILIVDRWGRYRDRFKWDDQYDMKRFLNVAKDLLAEQKPPFGSVVSTRNVMAGFEPTDINTVPWIQEFHLTDQESNKFFSKDLIGDVWIGNFFFVACPGICVEQNQYLVGLQQRLVNHPAQIVSISTDPNSDTPARLKAYARGLGADLSSWTFLTGDGSLIKRTSAEFFRAYSSGGHHTSLLFAVDRWGNVRGEFDWRAPAAEVEMIDLIDQLNSENAPPSKFERISVLKEPDAKKPSSGH